MVQVSVVRGASIKPTGLADRVDLLRLPRRRPTLPSAPLFASDLGNRVVITMVPG